MKTKRSVLSFLVIFACGFNGCVPTGDTQDDEQAIRNLIQEEVNAANAGDLDALLSVWIDDCIRMQPNAPITKGKEALKAQYSAIFEYVTLDYRVIPEEIVVANDWAFGRGAYTVSVKPKGGGQTSTDRGKYMDIYQRQPDGSWKYARHIWNSDVPTTSDEP